MVVCTIGFAKKNLRTFIEKLRGAGVKKVIEIRHLWRLRKKVRMLR